MSQDDRDRELAAEIAKRMAQKGAPNQAPPPASALGSADNGAFMINGSPGAKIVVKTPLPRPVRRENPWRHHARMAIWRIRQFFMSTLFGVWLALVLSAGWLIYRWFDAGYTFKELLFGGVQSYLLPSLLSWLPYGAPLGLLLWGVALILTWGEDPPLSRRR